MPIPDPITATLDLTTDADHAFVMMTARLGEWWPAEYTWAQDALAGIHIEATTGGRCVEVGPDDEARVWGTVVRCTPGEELAFRWQIDPDRAPQPNPERASLVTMRWRETAGGWGWPLLLSRYRDACGG